MRKQWVLPLGRRTRQGPERPPHAMGLLQMVILALAATALLLPQATQPTRPLSGLIPAGPLLYLETRDLAAALRDWNASSLKADWLKSDNYKVFTQTRLFMRLDQAQQEYAAAAGFAPNLSLAQMAAGGNSALALYDIGGLEFLYVTRMPQAQAYQSILWQSRAKFQPRRSAGIDYYIRQQQQRRAAFAVTNDLLLIGTSEQALAASLALIAGQSAPGMQDEPWYRNAVAAHPQAGEFRMVHNFARVVRTPYFRSYWVQKNTRELNQFAAFISDLDRSTTEFRERRTLLREEAAADLRPTEAAVAELTWFVPAEAGLYRAWARPEVDTAAKLIVEKLTSAQSGPAAGFRTAPAPANVDAAVGSEQDVDTRIDDAAVVAAAPSADLEALRRLLAGNAPQAMLQVQTAQLARDGVFVTTPTAIALLGERPWDATTARAAVESAVSKLWTISGIGAMSGPLSKATVAVSGRVLVAGNSADLVQSVLARSGAGPPAGAVYLARYQHAAELPKFERMMPFMDAPALRSYSGNAREPLFFSENIASLGRALRRIDTVSIESHDDGRAVTQTVVYKLQ